MAAPSDRRYSDTHEWHKVDAQTLTIGLTQHAVDELTDITYVELKAKGTALGAGDSVGEVESVKATSDVYCASAGEIIEVNAALSDDPSLINADPYGKGWLVKVRIGDESGLGGLMDASTYNEKYAT